MNSSNGPVLILVVFIQAFFLPVTLGQDPEPDRENSGENMYSIEWLGTLPNNSSSRGSAKASGLTDLIFGKQEAGLIRPLSVSLGEKGKICVADQGAGKILNIVDGSLKNLRIRRGQQESFPSLVGTCFLPGGRVIFTDSELNGVFVYDPDLRTIERLNDSLDLAGPTGIAWSEAKEEIWVAETRAHRLAVLSPGGNLIRRIGSRGTGAGEFNYPAHISVDPEGNVLVVDAMNHRVQIFDGEGVFVTMFGSAGDASGYFARPKGIACDSYGHIYVADALFHTVQIFDRSGRYLQAFGSRGEGEGQFWMPAGICISKDNHIFVSDSFNKRIQIFRLVE